MGESFEYEKSNRLEKSNSKSPRIDLHESYAHTVKAESNHSLPAEFAGTEHFTNLLSDITKEKNIAKSLSPLLKNAMDDSVMVQLPNPMQLLGNGFEQLQRSGKNLIHDGKNFIEGQFESWRAVSSTDATNILRSHYLEKSFHARCLQQLSRDGYITVGVIDDGTTTHARNTEARILASVPEHLRDHVRVRLFDVSQGVRKAYDEALGAAQRNEIAAVSVSGGLQPIELSKLTREIGATEITNANRARAFQAALSHLDNDNKQAMLDVQKLSYIIPTVTPIWNDGNTTAAAMAGGGNNNGNVIVTTLKGDNTHATRSSLPDIALEPLPGNGFTSQGPPRLIGAMLGTVGI